ncbi:MAG: MCE family protein [Acidimicrobiales bacterium]|nr:MCE family protein [Acidimicrobiales bacterium]
MSRRVLINLIFFNVVFGVMILWALGNIVSLDAVERPYKISGEFAQAAGVKANAEVTYLGVHYGNVSGVERTDGGVSVTMKIDRGKDIPAGSIARIFRKSAIGEPYIDFVPPEEFDEDGDSIEPGDNVPIERTTVPLEFSELLRSASALISSIDPDAAGGLLHELSLALSGRGQALRDITTSFDTLTQTFVERTDQLDRLAENSTRVTRVLADHRLSLGRSISNLRAVAESLRNAQGDLRNLLEIGPGFLRTTADLVADQKQNLDCLLTDLAPTIRTTGDAESLEDVEALLLNAPTAFGYVFNAVDQEPDGPWIRVNLIMPLDGEPAEIYVPRPSLPVVPTVSPCASTLQPAALASGAPSGAATAAPAGGSSAASNPRPAPRPASGVADALGADGELPNTGGRPMAALALFLAASALAAWCTQRPASRPR